MSLQSVVNMNVVTIAEQASLQEAAKQMRDANIGCLVVEAEKNGKRGPVGIITDRDIVMQIAENKSNLAAIKTSEVMSKDLLILKQNQGIKEAIDAMQEKGVRRAPVVDEQNKLVGLATTDDLLVLIAKELAGLVGIVQEQTDVH